MSRQTVYYKGNSEKKEQKTCYILTFPYVLLVKKRYKTGFEEKVLIR